MNLQPYDLLRCPLHPAAGTLDNLKSHLQCLQCGRRYPVSDGIVDLLLPDAEHQEFLETEARQWDAHAPHYEEKRQHDLIYQASVDAAVAALEPAAGDLVLDAACGTGMTLKAYLQPGLRLVALDLSMASLQRLRAEVNQSEILFVRGDLLALPFASATFDRVLCANALQHLPDATARRLGIDELGRVARSRGRVVVTAHSYSFSKRRKGWPKEGSAGSNSGAVQYVYRYEPQEFRELLSQSLDVERVVGAGLPLPYRLKLTPLSRRLEKVLRRFPASAHWGHMLVGVGRARERDDSLAVSVSSGDPAGCRTA